MLLEIGIPTNSCLFSFNVWYTFEVSKAWLVLYFILAHIVVGDRCLWLRPIHPLFLYFASPTSIIVGI
jgi:hypothetical protein